MTTVGGILERKEIGLSIGVSGTHNNTEIDSVTGHLRLAQVDTDGSGNPIFAEEGTWISDVINLEDKFADFEKVFSSSLDKGSSSIAILTRVSDNNMDWSDWVAVGYDGAILSDTKQYIQIRIDLFAGFVTDVFLVANSDFEKNKFVEEKEIRAGSYIAPTLTSNTSSPLGFAFSETNNISYPAWRAFDKSFNTYYATNNVREGILGFCFSADEYSVSEYSITSSSATVDSMPRDWVLEISKDTTNGLDGNWETVDSRNAQIWSSTLTTNYYKLQKVVRAKAFRIKWSTNNGHATTTRFGELDFFSPAQTALQLKRRYNFDMTQDSSWSDTGSLHRKNIARDEWLRIDRLEVIEDGN
ncbi:hypothetical protein P9305_08990 [Lysinibacillus capsici]|uniref:hypothetical protein n=1 Tax=Lysinibacillus capsici TaxID=2115968 RepID=UPI0028E53339|nr:hypothetical protein [Lysinibacillus capsici]MED4552856.1 hypothetical protein [Lysinibacillus capsici]